LKRREEGIMVTSHPIAPTCLWMVRGNKATCIPPKKKNQPKTPKKKKNKHPPQKKKRNMGRSA